MRLVDELTWGCNIWLKTSDKAVLEKALAVTRQYKESMYLHILDKR